MLFPSVGGYMLKDTEAIICFILFSHQFYDRSYGSSMINTKFRTNLKMLFPSVGGYMLKNTEAIICFVLFSHQFPDCSYGSYML